MKKRLSIAFEVFLAILSVALGAVLAVGLVTRRIVGTALDTYLANMAPSAVRPRMMGRRMLGVAEQTLVSGVNRGVLIGAVVAVAIAALAAWLLARYLTRPLSKLEDAAEEFAAGDLSHRVGPEGPAEVAALADAFNRMADSLEEAEELRQRMVADVAHELRNPIAAIRAQIEGMAEGVLPADDARLASLSEDVTHLTALVSDLQDLAVAEAGQLAYDMGTLDIRALCAREVERARAGAPDGVVVELDARDALEVVGDERRLSEVLRNLLVNAMRHTSAGSVTVRVAREGDMARVSVVDTGEGIASEDLPYVFERFYRADPSRAATSGGSGLGLSISRRIVADHGGVVFAASERGSGSTIGFALPLA